ncbi:MAG TPA: cyclophilin-like fold protein [Candidatus Limnocylindria bacterium]|nr:cyclophilin-like fold protein [Candidatus Limnocylindria bacterium]
MGRTIRILAGDVTATAELNDSPTAGAIWDALPLEAKASTWGDEIYFDIGIPGPPDASQEVVELGDLGFWPPGRAFCVFFGPTPMSRGDEIRPASAVTVVGRVAGDCKVFTKVRAGAKVRLERGAR